MKTALLTLLTVSSALAQVLPFDVGGGIIVVNSTSSTIHIATGRATAGSPEIIDPAGNSWGMDSYFTDGNLYSTDSVTQGTDNPLLYKQCRYGVFFYKIPVMPGQYKVNLFFAEPVYTTPGSRVFNVNVNGVPFLNNFDIVAESGPMKAVTKTVTVVAQDFINIDFLAGTADWPLVNGIEIVPSVSTTTSSRPLVVLDSAFVVILGKAPTTWPPVEPCPFSAFMARDERYWYGCLDIANTLKWQRLAVETQQ